jgi:hypothetical protein
MLHRRLVSLSRQGGTAAGFGSRISRRAEQNKLDRESTSSVVANLGKCEVLIAICPRHQRCRRVDGGPLAPFFILETVLPTTE